jgi:hypothetical protein
MKWVETGVPCTMKAERLSLAGVTGILLVTALGVALPSLLPGIVDWRTVFELTLWGTTALFAVTAVVWVVLTYVVGAGYETPEAVHGGDDIQVRILTVDADDVVQATVDSLPDALDDVHIIAESPMAIDGATVDVVPDEFACEAVRKGRALEWARQAIDCEREFVLYLDEDSRIDSFTGLPDADVRSPASRFRCSRGAAASPSGRTSKTP